MFHLKFQRQLDEDYNLVIYVMSEATIDPL